MRFSINFSCLCYVFSFYTQNTDNNRETEETELYRTGDEIAESTSFDDEINTQEEEMVANSEEEIDNSPFNDDKHSESWVINLIRLLL